MLRGTYIGEWKAIQNQGALLQLVPKRPGRVLAQFDNLLLGRHWTHAWKIFNLSDFKIDEQFPSGQKE